VNDDRTCRVQGQPGCRRLLLLLLLPGALVGCRPPSDPPPPIAISGSSTVFPILQQSLAAWRASHPREAGAFNLREVGTTAGLKAFCLGDLAVANASRPINSSELRACAARGIDFIELPIAFDAVTVVVHPSNTWARQITTKELARLWGRQAQGTVTRWSQVNNDWPDSPIRLCGPGKDSGTFDYFNKAINGDEGNSRQDVVVSEDDNRIVRCVADHPDAIGYFGFGYFRANAGSLKPVAIDAGKGAILPSLQSVQDQTYTPLSRPLFIYVNDGIMRRNALLRRFVTFTVGQGLGFVEKAGFIPLPGSTYRVVESKLHRHLLGTSFGGDLPVGLGIGEALRRSFDETRRPEFR
jgi:phosphate transport system substrate-binding protein